MLMRIEYVCRIFLCFVLYILVGGLVHEFVLDPVWSMILSYGILLCALGVWALITRHKPPVDESKYWPFSLFGWVVLLAIFFMLYWSAECLGNYLYLTFPDVGISNTYVSMKGLDLLVYTILGCTMAPVVEELMFRRFVFGYLRRRFSFFFSAGASSVLFALMHGTLMHLPLALALSLFLCLLYEVTGKFYLCVLFHILFNVLAASYLVSISVDNIAAVIVYVFVVVFLVFSYIKRERLFGVYFKVGGLDRFESYLDEKRKHLAERK